MEDSKLIIDQFRNFLDSNPSDPWRVFVRLSRSYWHDNDGIYIKTTLRYLKRKCSGFNCFDNDCDLGGAEWGIKNIINLDECKDGIYELIIVNEHRDWETGIVEDWEWKLIELEEENKK